MATEEIFDLYHPQPLLVVISGTSGVGKDAVLNELKRREAPLHFVVTVNTRVPRLDEVEGRDYYFISKERFFEMVARGELLEHAHVYDDYKGVPQWEVDRALASGKDTILRVDVQGAERIRNLYPQAVLIFLVPTCVDEWYKRLSERGTETEESLRVRVETATDEVKKIGMFDYVVVNAKDCLAEAVDTVQEIISAEHHRVHHRVIEA
jgi:guanylate kinase